MDLHLHPVLVPGDADTPPAQGGWYGPADWPALGLPAPVRKLLEGL